MKIQGTGIVSTLGRGIETLESALKHGPVEPTCAEVPFQESPFPVYAVAHETLNDPALLRRARRADRFSKMATLAAADAVRESGTELNPERTGLLLGTAFGPHPTVFRFLDEILDYGDAAVSPTVFSHSVHNAAASYLSVALGLAGPAMTITSFVDPFYQSLLIAQTWLEQDVCDAVLVGCTEEIGTVMEYIVSQKLPLAEAGAMRPFFDPAGPAVIPGEGAVFFLLSRESGTVSLKPDGTGPAADLNLVDFEYRGSLPTNAPCGCWSHLTGCSPLSGAVSCAVAALMLTDQLMYDEVCAVEIKPPPTLRSIDRIGTAGRRLRIERRNP